MKVYILGFLLSLAATDAPRITFTKSFPGSTPAYESISVERTGTLTYKESEKDDQPITADLPDGETQSLFEMADKLNHFKDPIESGLNVANTGKKTFRYDSDTGAVTQTTFNYSQNLIAQQLLDHFERIAATERAYIDLDRTARFDKLGVNDALAAIESLWLKKQLEAPRQFLPLLTRVANHETYMHIARDRAARLREAIEAPTAAPASQGQQQ